MPATANPSIQLEQWRKAVDAIGGQRAAARALHMSDRSIGRLYSGAYPLHDGILADTAKALLVHADLCRQLERRLSPAFSGNLTERQRTQDMRGRARRTSE